MIDRETESVWTHLDGNAIEGPLKGQRLTILPAPQVTWGEWKELHPDAVVLSPDTPFRNRYRPVTIGVFSQREAVYGDDRLSANELVVGVEANGQFKGYPLVALGPAGGVLNDELSGEPIVVLYERESRTGLAFSRALGNRVLRFYNASEGGFELRDRETGSLWTRDGEAVSGPLSGAALEFVPSFISEWYGWSAYHPETDLHRAGP